ncbi:Uncharacterised protein [Mycobacterium tuberculosis]|uniref:Uncharacterized protein n=1 Tax=Mycobacterium tuberculosis TaxID=1773 RepID=A0A655JHG4_MYCTX|nr:Uncharacterised protein [Mycobacterium tuberculosis]CKV15628.1 Uncharacterised protein [Mycobacterium tuberculosis]COW93429.1 Uncharacterised protein [Mycobacterium tuberculosis]COY25306.1 Uncharacterised protein [Mycobacterium tuberculosis]SGO93458.1 Uncharacterised protein [Mycobacterium tuberculosis]
MLALMSIPVASSMAQKAARVTRPPPIRSASLPPYIRDSDPNSGPRKAIWAACSEACAVL